MGEHASFSISKLATYAACPGKWAAENAAKEAGVEDKVSQAAIDGTRRHEVIEYCIRNPTMGIPEQVESGAVTSDDIMAVSKIWPYFENHPALVDPYNDFWVEERLEVGRAVEKLTDGDWALADQVWGTGDLVAIHGNTLEVLDNKFGFHQVSPESLQLQAYTVGAGLLIDWFGKHQRVARSGRIKLTIAQPTGGESLEDCIRSKTYSIDMMQEWAKEIRDVVDAAAAPGAPRVPGEDQCRFCLAKGTCRERMETASMGLFEALDVETAKDEPPTVEAISEVVEAKMTGDPKEMTPGEIGAILDQAPMIEGFLAGVRKEAYKRLDRGDTEFMQASGWKLVKGNRKREWTIPREEREKSLRRIGFKVVEIYPKKLVSLAAADTTAKGMSKPTLAKFSELWEWRDGKPLMVPEGDERPPLGADLFEALETEKTKDNESDYPDWY